MEQNQSKGLGDTVAKITHATGLDKIVKAVARTVGKNDCGCGRRQQKLNELVPYKNKQENKGHETGQI